MVDSQAMKVKLVALNLAASKRAASASSFATAVDVLGCSKVLLESLENPWQDHYELCLDVYSSLTEYAIGAGLMDVHEDSAESVIKHSTSPEDSGRVYLAQLRVLFMQGKHDIYQQRAIEILRQLGETIPDVVPTRKAEKCLEQAKQLLKSNTKESIDALPATFEPKTILITTILSEALMLTSSSQARPGLVAYIYHRLLAITMEKGTTPLCTTAFPGAWVCLFGKLDIDSLYEIGKWGTMLVDKAYDDNVIRFRVLGHLVAMAHWKESMQLVLEKNLQGFRLAMMAGDIMSAFRFVTIYCYTYLYSGLRLPPLVNDLDNYCRLMESFGIDLYHFQILPMKQAAKNIVGLSPDILVIHQGEVEAFRNRRGWKSRHGEQVEFGVRMQLAFYTSNLELATEMYEKLVKADSVLKNAGFYPPRVFFFTLICIANFKKTRKQKHRKRAKEHLALVKHWVTDCGAVNVVHKLMILQAEMKSLEFNRHKISAAEEKELKAAYDEAISCSSRVGFVQDAGLAAHLACKALRDDDLQSRYFEQALDFYGRWGATGLVQYLQENTKSSRGAYGANVSSCLISLDGQCTGGDESAVKSEGRGSLRGRERYDRSIIDGLQRRLSELLFPDADEIRGNDTTQESVLSQRCELGDCTT